MCMCVYLYMHCLCWHDIQNINTRVYASTDTEKKIAFIYTFERHVTQSFQDYAVVGQLMVLLIRCERLWIRSSNSCFTSWWLRDMPGIHVMPLCISICICFYCMWIWVYGCTYLHKYIHVHRHKQNTHTNISATHRSIWMTCDLEF